MTKVSNWEEADDSSLIFLEANSKHANAAALPLGACVVAPRDLVPPGWNIIFSEKPKLDFARAAQLLQPRPMGRGKRHPSAVVSPEATIGDDVDIGPSVMIEALCRIGSRTILHAGVHLGQACVVGEQCILHPKVVLYPGVEIGHRVILHAGAVLGGDGFGYVFDGQAQVKFPQVGRVVIEDDVEIGANTTIDRGSLGTTRIGRGSKIDNLVQIAHNVQIGQQVVIAAQTGISGSTVIEDLAVIGGQVGFGDHVRVQRGAVIGSKAGVLPGKIVRGGEVYWGVPIRPLREFKRLNALFSRLPEIKTELDSLKQALSKLEKAVHDLQNRK